MRGNAAAEAIGHLLTRPVAQVQERLRRDERGVRGDDDPRIVVGRRR